jgi:hypothetical protein
MSPDPGHGFDHPGHGYDHPGRRAGHPLRGHVLNRLRR